MDEYERSKIKSAVLQENGRRERWLIGESDFRLACWQVSSEVTWRKGAEDVRCGTEVQ